MTHPSQCLHPLWAEVGKVGGKGEIYGKMDEWINGSPFEMFPWNNSLTCGRDEILLEVFGFLAINNLLSQLFQKSMQVCKKAFGFPLWN